MDQPNMFRAKGDGIEIQITEWPGDGLPVLAVHGLTANSRCFDVVAPRISPPHRILAVDLRGRGLSDKPDTGYSVDHHCRDLEAVMDHLQLEQVVLLGHSLGAIISLALAAGIPERVKGLVMMDAGAKLSLEDWAKVSSAIKPSLDRLEQSFSSFEAYIENLKMAPFLQPWNEAIENYFRYESEEVDGKLRSRINPTHINEETENLLSLDTGPWYPKVRCPVLVLRAGKGVFSDDDLLIPEYTLPRLQEDLPRSKLVNLDQVNHYSIIMQPDEDRDRAILEFLKDIN